MMDVAATITNLVLSVVFAILGFILLFIGLKIIVADTFDLIHVPAWVSLAVTLVLLTIGIVYSLWRTRENAGHEAEADALSDPRAARRSGSAAS